MHCFDVNTFYVKHYKKIPNVEIGKIKKRFPLKGFAKTQNG